VPLGEAVVLAMLASYILSRTLVPTLAMYWLRMHDHAPQIKSGLWGFFQRIHFAFEKFFQMVRRRSDHSWADAV